MDSSFDKRFGVNAFVCFSLQKKYSQKPLNFIV